jgi:TfoX/Sxy family transcriptional regulator of competence genes
MAYDETLAHRTRELIAGTHQKVEEKKMFGGLCFMVNGKMCVGVMKDKMMVRLDPVLYEEVLEKEGCSEMDFSGRPMKGFVFVDTEALRNKKQLAYWVGLALDFNKTAKKAPKKKR